MLSVLEESGRCLGIGLAGFVNIFYPEVIAVGGRAMGAGELMLAYVRQEVSARARPAARDLVEVREATLALFPACSAQRLLPKTPLDAICFELLRTWLSSPAAYQLMSRLLGGSGIGTRHARE